MRKTLHIVVVLVTLLWLSGVSGVLAQSETGRPFITKWKGEAGKELKIPIVGTYKMVIKDGSGNEKVNEMVTVADAKQSYIFTPTENGTYTVEAGPEGVKSMQMKAEWKDETEKWEFFASYDELLEVVQFGTVKWESMEEMFRQCKNMTFAAGIDTPDLSKVTKMRRMFEKCSSFNQPLNNWNVSNVTDMAGMFMGCSSFNQPLGNWNVSNVTEMNYMFYDCSSFNQPLNDWNVSSVTYMVAMFLDCSSFNQPLGNWNVNKVTNMRGMFRGCSSFNQPLGNWDVSNVTDMNWMFKGCSSFNQPLDNWNVSNVENMREMFHYCFSFNQPLGSWKIKTVVEGLPTTAMSPSNYSQTLVGWAGQTNIAGNLNFVENVKDLIYNDEGKVARQKLIDKGWIFINNVDIYQSSGVAITPHSLPLVFNKEFTLPLEKWGVVETEEEVTLSTDAEGIISYKLTADKKGVHIKGLKEGKCKLTATIAAKPGVHDTYTSTCEIEVYIPIERITITPASKTLKVGEEFTLTVNIFPENATKKDVSWRSYDSKIVTVDNNWKVTAKAAGECTVYAEINEYGRRFKGRCEVTVEEPSNGGNTGENGGGNGGNNGGNNGGGNGGNTGGDNNGGNPTTFAVTLTRPTNGKIEIEGHATETTITVAKDTELTVKATPNEGYKLKTLKANNKDITTTLKFIVTAATTVTAVFEKQTFVVTPSVNNEACGSIELTGASNLTAVPYGTELIVNVTENEGYKLKSLTAGDKDITETKKFIVKAATEVKAVFESKQKDNNRPGAVEDALLAGISVAPNPFTSQLCILNPEGVAARYELVNASGMVVRSGALSGSEAIVNTETLPAGIYFVRLEAQNGAQKSVMVSK